MPLLGILSFLFLTFQGPVQVLQAAIACTSTRIAHGARRALRVILTLLPKRVYLPQYVVVRRWAIVRRMIVEDSFVYGDRIVTVVKVVQFYKGTKASINACPFRDAMRTTERLTIRVMCQGECSVSGVRCNGQGSCNMVSLSPGKTPNFSYTCENGYSGNKCEIALHGQRKPPPRNIRPLATVTRLGKILDDDSGVEDWPTAGRRTKSGIHTGWLIFILVIAVVIMLGTVLWVVYIIRKRKQQQEAEEYANALASAEGVGAVGLRDLAAGHTGHTPRAHIVSLV
ncbi:unnamed protein product [Peronospora farinosa]|uniref:EGF-like domain-containing protein n=1 Tax=Peronospora farinosa TaxID=134698 RepID=A0AAV0TCY0_9STRA|nr:unnamed protein product [Peronospora farinosa]